jgi:hypothetical protein
MIGGGVVIPLALLSKVNSTEVNAAVMPVIHMNNEVSFGILNRTNMVAAIEKADIIATSGISIRKILSPMVGPFRLDS